MKSGLSDTNEHMSVKLACIHMYARLDYYLPDNLLLPPLCRLASLVYKDVEDFFAQQGLYPRLVLMMPFRLPTVSDPVVLFEFQDLEDICEAVHEAWWVYNVEEECVKISRC